PARSIARSNRSATHGGKSLPARTPPPGIRTASYGDVRFTSLRYHLIDAVNPQLHDLRGAQIPHSRIPQSPQVRAVDPVNPQLDHLLRFQLVPGGLQVAQERRLHAVNLELHVVVRAQLRVAGALRVAKVLRVDAVDAQLDELIRRRVQPRLAHRAREI